MAKLIFLGTSSAVPDKNHENTHLILVGERQVVLVDCVSNPVVRLGLAGVDPLDVTELVLTHFHPDHVSGVPLLLMDMWLLGRVRALHVYGLQVVLEKIQQIMAMYEWHKWPEFFPVHFHAVPPVERSLLLDGPEFRLYASPVRHMIPTIGLRVESIATGRIAAYSCDTEPCDEVARLAEGADILIHEATGAEMGHSSAVKAAETARKAEVATLYLIHYPVVGFDPSVLPAQAASEFQGSVILAQDLMEVAL